MFNSKNVNTSLLTGETKMTVRPMPTWLASIIFILSAVTLAPPANAQFRLPSTNGNQYRGNYRTDGRGNFAAEVSYQNHNGYRYGGGVERNGNSTRVQGEYWRPGYVPGTQERYTGGVILRGETRAREAASMSMTLRDATALAGETPRWMAVVTIRTPMRAWVA